MAKAHYLKCDLLLNLDWKRKDDKREMWRRGGGRCYAGQTFSPFDITITSKYVCTSNKTTHCIVVWMISWSTI